MKKTRTFEYEVLESKDQLDSGDQHLVSAAMNHLSASYSPYSNFKVAAAILLANGEVVLGSNQENMAYPSGLCAERVAFFSARTQHPTTKILKVAITAASEKYPVGYPVTPCGSCRQVMLEYEIDQDSPIELILTGETGQIYKLFQVKDLIPLHFFEKNLKED